jgi:hypothetical protein
MAKASKRSRPRCLLIAGPNGGTRKAKRSSKSLNKNPKFAARVERALVRAGESARRIARMHGTPIYIWENGKVIAKRP